MGGGVLNPLPPIPPPSYGGGLVTVKSRCHALYWFLLFVQYVLPHPHRPYPKPWKKRPIPGLFLNFSQQSKPMYFHRDFKMQVHIYIYYRFIYTYTQILATYTVYHFLVTINTLNNVHTKIHKGDCTQKMTKKIEKIYAITYKKK